MDQSEVDGGKRCSKHHGNVRQDNGRIQVMGTQHSLEKSLCFSVCLTFFSKQNVEMKRVKASGPFVSLLGRTPGGLPEGPGYHLCCSRCALTPAHFPLAMRHREIYGWDPRVLLPSWQARGPAPAPRTPSCSSSKGPTSCECLLCSSRPFLCLGSQAFSSIRLPSDTSSQQVLQLPPLCTTRRMSISKIYHTSLEDFTRSHL